MSQDFEDLLNMTWDDIPVPQTIPDGGWMLAGANVALVKPKDDNGDLKVLFTYKAKSPVSVAQDLLDEMGEYDITINDLNYTIYIKSAADWDKVRKHVALHGIELEGALFTADKKLAFAKAFRNAEIVAEVGTRSYENSEGVTVFDNSLSKFQRVTE